MLMRASPPDESAVAALPECEAVRAEWTVAAVALAAVCVGAMLRNAELSIDFAAPGSLALLALLGGLGAARSVLARARTAGARMVRDFAEYVALFTAVSLIGAVASYPVSAFTHGFADPSLYRLDRALHFDWTAWYQAVAARPWLQVLSRSAYALIYLSPAVLLGYFAQAGKRREAYDFIHAVAIAAALTLLVFRFVPAVGPFGYLWHQPIPYLPVSDLWQPDLIPQLRAHVAPPIDLGHLVGLVSVPSFHAAAAVLLIAFGARHSALRWPMLLANSAMLLATPVEGTHYLVDMIAGALIAFAALAIVAAAPARTPRERPMPRARGRFGNSLTPAPVVVRDLETT